jgi:hypothetical protein
MVDLQVGSLAAQENRGQTGRFLAGDRLMGEAICVHHPCVFQGRAILETGWSLSKEEGDVNFPSVPDFRLSPISGLITLFL